MLSDNSAMSTRLSQYPYVGLNNSVTECPIEIILSGMTYYHHWFKEFVKSKNIRVRFVQMKVHFRIYLIVCIVRSSQILLAEDDSYIIL